MKGSQVAVIGGGPGGILCAAHLAKRGARVTVYEEKKLQDQVSVKLGWPIVIGPMGTDSIELAGLSSDFGAGHKNFGMLAQRAQAWSSTNPEENTQDQSWVPGHRLMVTRASLVRDLREQVVSEYSDLVKFEDGYSIVGGNLKSGEVLLKKLPEQPDSGTAEVIKVNADLVVGADGAKSTTRALLQQQDASLKVEKRVSERVTIPFKMPHVDSPEDYEALQTPSGVPMSFSQYTQRSTDSDAFGVLAAAAPGASKGVNGLIMSWQEDGAVQVAALNCTKEWVNEERPMEETLAVLEAAFPNTPCKWLRACAEQIAKDPSSARVMASLKCSKLGTGRCVLIGDAAHASLPGVGTGLQSALQDCAVLGELTESSLKHEELAQAYTEARLRDVHALDHINRAFSVINTTKPRIEDVVKLMPVWIPLIVQRMKFPGKKWLKFPSLADFMDARITPKEMEDQLRGCFAKIAGATALVLAMAVSLAAPIV